jgi:hypothetical protein
MYAINDLDEYLQSCRVEPVAYGCSRSHTNKEIADEIKTAAPHTPPLNTLDDEEVSGDD